MTDMTALQNGWEGILEPGETVLWQGRPDTRPDFSGLRAGNVVLGLAVAGFALFVIRLALPGVAMEGPLALILPLIGLFFVGLGLQRAGGYIFWDVYRRSRTWYSLTDRRAFVATNILGRRDLAAYPITRSTVLDHDGREPGSIWFATDYVKTRRGSSRRKVGFERLGDSATVFDLMVKVQREQA